MNHIEAMKQALETCDGIAKSNWREWEELASAEEFERWVKSRANHTAIALRAAIEQAEEGAKRLAEIQSRIANIGQQENERCLEKYGTLDCPRCGGSGHIGDAESVEQAEKCEPYAYEHEEFVHGIGSVGSLSYRRKRETDLPLFTHPAPVSQCAPELYKLVPIEPTGEMEIAGALAYEQSRCHDNIGPLQNAWAAMLTAAPAPIQPEVGSFVGSLMSCGFINSKNQPAPSQHHPLCNFWGAYLVGECPHCDRLNESYPVGCMTTEELAAKHFPEARPAPSQQAAPITYKAIVVDDQHPNGIPLKDWVHPAPTAPAPSQSQCVHKDTPEGCYRVRCQLGKKCADDGMSPREATPSQQAAPQRTWVGLAEAAPSQQNIKQELAEWIKATGCIPIGGSWHYELESLIERSASSQRAAQTALAWMRPSIYAECQPETKTLREVADEWIAEGHVVTALGPLSQAEWQELTREEACELAHRRCTRYHHDALTPMYTFTGHDLMDFLRDVRAKNGGAK
jgi:hypothetical protein